MLDAGTGGLGAPSAFSAAMRPPHFHSGGYPSEPVVHWGPDGAAAAAPHLSPHSWSVCSPPTAVETAVALPEGDSLDEICDQIRLLRSAVLPDSLQQSSSTWPLAPPAPPPPAYTGVAHDLGLASSAVKQELLTPSLAGSPRPGSPTFRFQFRAVEPPNGAGSPPPSRGSWPGAAGRSGAGSSASSSVGVPPPSAGSFGIGGSGSIFGGGGPLPVSGGARPLAGCASSPVGLVSGCC